MKLLQTGNPILKARKTIWKAFCDDPDFKDVYVANIAMMLYDYLNITDHQLRNKVAEKMVNFLYKEE